MLDLCIHSTIAIGQFKILEMCSFSVVEGDMLLMCVGYLLVNTCSMILFKCSFSLSLRWTWPST